MPELEQIPIEEVKQIENISRACASDRQEPALPSDVKIWRRAGLSGSLQSLIILPSRTLSNRNYLGIDWMYLGDDGLELECITSSPDIKNHTGMFLRHGSRADRCGLGSKRDNGFFHAWTVPLCLPLLSMPAHWRSYLRLLRFRGCRPI
jgi:hypothetical protein